MVYRRSMLLCLTLLLFLSATLFPQITLARPIVPEPGIPQGNEPPTTLVDRDVTSFSVPSPGLYYHTDALCPPRPPGRATDDTTSPDTGSAASDFYLRRTTIRGDETRTLVRKFDSSPPPAWNCNPYKIYSNIVADQEYVFWVDASGLVRLPVSANIYDSVQLLNGAYSDKLPVELTLAGDQIVLLLNRPATPGPFGTLGNSRVDLIDRNTGQATTRKFYFGFDAGLRTPSFDGEYIYYLNGVNELTRLDSGGSAVILAGSVRSYAAEGAATFCPTLTCTTTKYLFYSQGANIRRHDSVDGSDILLHNRPGNIGSMLVSRAGFSPLLVGQSLFFFESIFTPSGGFGGTYTHTLYRTGRSPGAELESLYFFNDASITPVSPSRMSSNGDFLFWTEGAGPLQKLKRLPNNVDALPRIDMSVTGLQITQGLQNNTNSVRLVRNRETYVRLFVAADGQNVAGATMRLYGTFNGIEHGPLLPQRSTHIIARAAPDRTKLDEGFLFVLPWAWSQQTEISLRAVLNPFQIPPEPSYANNQLVAGPFAFSQQRPMDLVLVEANYRIQRSLNDFSDYVVPDTQTHVDWIRRAYPIAEDGINLRVWRIEGGALLGNLVMQTAQVCRDMPAASRSLCASDWVNAKLAEMRKSAGNGVNAATLTYGLITDSGGTGGAFPRGQAGTSRIGSGPAGSSIINGVRSDYGYYTGHEIGHMYGRGHPVPNSDDPATTVDSMNNPIIEGCGHSRSDASYPYANALIGRGDGAIQGFDRGGSVPSLLGDTLSFDMMSYCGAAELRWPSDYTWEALYQAILNSPTAAANTATVLGGDWLSLIGFVYGDRVVVQSLARLANVTGQSDTDAGAYRLILLDDSESELARYHFDPLSEESDGEGRWFDLTVPFVTGARDIQIVEVDSGAVRLSRPLSPNPPLVSELTLSESSADPVDGLVSLTWKASDPDGDGLSADLLFSSDSGTTFRPLAWGITGDRYEIDTSHLPGGDGIFRVVVSDGFQRSQSDSPIYRLSVKTPSIRIIKPGENAQFNWGQAINLSAEALDPQDGLLSGESVQWSNQHGPLGAGAQLTMLDLPTGLNLIQTTATNSAGMASTAVLSLIVGDRLDLPGPKLEISPAALGFHFAADQKDEQQAIVALDNSGSGAINWSVTSGESWISFGAPDGPTPDRLIVTVDARDLAAGRLHRGTITIRALAQNQPDQVTELPVELSIGNGFFNPSGVVVADPGGDERLYLPAIAGP